MLLCAYGGMKRPPRKWRPRCCLAHSLGAVREMSRSGRMPVPCGSPGQECMHQLKAFLMRALCPSVPCSTSQPEGTSTEATGTEVRFIVSMTTSNGARGAPEKLC